MGGGEYADDRPHRALNLHGPDAVVFGCATILIGAGLWCLMRGVAKESHTRMATGLAMIAVALVGAVVGVIFA